jgi:DsbC/DsbD-like thiol-disulfide interchange protein
MRGRAGIVSLLGAVALAAGARAQAPVVDVTAVPEYAGVQPGGTFRVAIRLLLPAGWHIYWINPGPGGLATTLAWHLPGGVTGGETEWPYPETDGADDANVYRGTVVVFSTFSARPGVTGRATLTADMVWGLCREQCVRQERTVTLTLPVARGAPVRTSAWSEAEVAARFLPMHRLDATIEAAAKGDSIRLVMTAPAAGPAPGSWVTWFPLEQGRASVVAPVRAVPGGIAVTLPRAAATGAPPGRLSGVLVPAHAPGSPPPVRAIAVQVTVAP